MATYFQSSFTYTEREEIFIVISWFARRGEKKAHPGALLLLLRVIGDVSDTVHGLMQLGARVPAVSQAALVLGLRFGIGCRGRDSRFNYKIHDDARGTRCNHTESSFASRGLPLVPGCAVVDG
jgi:hypothetical protein